MFRRSFITALSVASVLPFGSTQPESAHPPAVPEEGSLMFWYHFYSAMKRDQVMSTERARERTVTELNLTTLTTDEARQFLKLANEGAYEIEDIPENFQNVFEQLERDVA